MIEVIFKPTTDCILTRGLDVHATARLPTVPRQGERVTIGSNGYKVNRVRWNLLEPGGTPFVEVFLD
jgi:hypothetical protein